MKDKKELSALGYGLVNSAFIGIIYTFSIHFLDARVTGGYFIFGLLLIFGIISYRLSNKIK